PLHRRAPRTARDRPRHAPEPAQGIPPRGRVPRGLRRPRSRARPALLLPGDPPPGDRRVARDPVPRTTARRALGPLRRNGGRPPPDLGRARPRPRRALARGRPLARRLARRPRRDVLAPLGGDLRRVPAPGRVRRRTPRSDLAPLLRLPVRERLLGDRAAVVEL